MKKRKREPQYNWVYKKLTEDGQSATVLNYIAYAFYKQEKILTIESFKKTHGHYPDDDELASFRTLSQSDDKIKEYRNKAETMLQNYSDSVDEAIVKEAIKGILDKKDHGFWYGVWQSVVGSALFILVCLGIAWLVHCGGVSIPFVSVDF